MSLLLKNASGVCAFSGDCTESCSASDSSSDSELEVWCEACGHRFRVRYSRAEETGSDTSREGAKQADQHEGRQFVVNVVVVLIVSVLYAIINYLDG